MDNKQLSSHIDELLNQLISDQKIKMLALGRQFVPHLTADDILQPNDFYELEFEPHFRYEEGVLAGLQTAQMAIRASLKQTLPSER